MPDPEAQTIVATRRKGQPELTVGDRFITAMMGFLCAFLTMCLVWLVALRFIYAGPEAPLPFYWTWMVGLLAGAASFAAGPERTMDVFGKVWRVIGAIFFRRRSF